MKKIFSLLLTLLMLLGIFCSCSDGSGSDTAVYRIGICQFLEHTAVDSATEGFKAALTEKLGDEVSFDVKNASTPYSASVLSSFFSTVSCDLSAHTTP